MRSFVVRLRPLLACLRQPLVLAACGVTLLFLIIVVKRLCPLGVPGEGQWVWVYRKAVEVAPSPPLILPLLVFASVVAVWAYVWEQGERRTLRRAGGALTFFVVGTVVLRVAVQNVNPPLTQGATFVGWTVVSRVSTTYFADVLTVQDVPEFLRTFPERMRRSDWHGQTHPPGTILFFYLVNRALHESPALADAARRLMQWSDWREVRSSREAVQQKTGVELDDVAMVAAAASGYLLSFIGVLGLIPLTLLTRRLFDERTAWAATLLWLVAPSLNLFFPVVDQVYLTLALVVLWLLGEGLTRQSGEIGKLGNWEIGNGWFVAAGCALAFGLFMTFSLLAMLVLCLLWVGLTSHQQRDVLWKRLGLFVVGLLLPLVILYALFGLNMLTVLKIALTAHGGVTERRIRSVWMVVNLLDFFVFIGLPITLFFVVSCWQHIRQMAGTFQRFNVSTFRLSAASALLLSFTATLLLLDVSGVVRGEVARIWMFLMPVPLMWAACWMAADERCGGLRVGILSSATLLQTLVLQWEVWFVRPW